jgi:hypothetical protein
MTAFTYRYDSSRGQPERDNHSDSEFTKTCQTVERRNMLHTAHGLLIELGNDKICLNLKPGMLQVSICYVY